MFFLNYKETDLNYINNSCLRLIFIRQVLEIKNSYILKLPRMKYYFIFRKIVDINLLKIFNNIMLIWLLTGKTVLLKNFFVKLERGVKYYRFFLTSKEIDNIEFFFIILSFLSNTLFYLMDNRFFKKYDRDNVCFFKLSDLEFFSNIRLANNFYTSKLNDIVYIYFFINKYYFISLKKILNCFKIVI